MNGKLGTRPTVWTGRHRPEGRHILDFSNWKDHDAYQVAFDRLLRDLKRAPGEQDEPE